jgi:tRNA A-37 threonylcarbamoyl transferase component Bud32
MEEKLTIQDTASIPFSHRLSRGIIRYFNLFLFAGVLGSERIHYFLFANSDLHSMKSRKEQLLKFKDTGLWVSLDEIGIKKEGNEKRYSEMMKSPEYFIGEFDQDGYILSNLDAIEGISTIDKEHFLPRNRFKLYLVSVYGRIGVKKDYRGNKVSFLIELRVYSRLAGKNINVPTLLDVDYDRLTITFSYIPGPTVREKLFDIGAVIIDHTLLSNPELQKIPGSLRWLIQTENKSETLYTVVDKQFSRDLLNEIKKIHDCDVFISDLKYGNIIIEKTSHQPYLLDFDQSRDISEFRNYIKKFQKNKDIQLFNRLFFCEQ